MFRHFHLTRQQWKQIVKWLVYAAFFLGLLLMQTVVLAKKPLFGVKLCLIPALLVCVCVKEGPEAGGLFALLGSVFWCLSGADYGNLAIVTLTVCAILSSVLFRTTVTDRLPAVWLFVLFTYLINDSVIFLFKVILVGIDPRNYWRVLLPCAGMSSVFAFIIYPVVRAIHRIGGSNGI